MSDSSASTLTSRSPDVLQKLFMSTKENHTNHAVKLVLTASACVYKWVNIAGVGLEWLHLFCIKRSHARQLSGVFPLRFLVLIGVCMCVCGRRTTTASDRQVGGEVTSCFHFALIYKHSGFSLNRKKMFNMGRTVTADVSLYLYYCNAASRSVCLWVCAEVQILLLMLLSGACYHVW